MFEVEAARDGRLTGTQLGSLQRHVIKCAECSRESHALEALANSLRMGAQDIAPADELHVRRERTRLLAAFDGALLAPRRPWSARRLVWSAAVVTLVAGIVILLRVRRPVEQTALASRAVVHADSTAVWSERMEGDRESIALERGALWIHVDHAAGPRGLLIVLPDGELEDTGTTFSVSAEDGHTTRVAVQEGHVVLRIHGQTATAMGPGDAWAPNPQPAAASAWVSAARPTDTAPAARVDAADRTTPPPPSEPAVSRPASAASADFRAAMAAFDVGDNHQAAAAFASFLAKHPRDARAEDAAYLHVIALQRSGDGAGMKQAALEYLHRYPQGFRQSEVEPLSR
jgi:hypothetical protein